MDTFKALASLKEFQSAFPRCTAGLRRYLDAILMKHHHPIHDIGQMNYRELGPVRDLIRRTSSVKALIDAGLPPTKISAQVILDHVTSMKQLREYLKNDKFDLLITSYEIGFVTRNEDVMLRQAECDNVKNADRYTVANVVLLPPPQH